MYVNLPTALTYAVMPTYPTSNLNHLNVMAYASISIFSKIPVHVFSRAQSLHPKRKEKNRDNTHIFQTSLHIPNRPGPIQLYYSLSSFTLENLSFSLSLCKRSHRKLCPPPIRKILPKSSQQQQAVRARNYYPGISNPSWVNPRLRIRKKHLRSNYTMQKWRVTAGVVQRSKSERETAKEWKEERSRVNGKKKSFEETKLHKIYKFHKGVWESKSNLNFH
jgi:hypothetical protein